MKFRQSLFWDVDPKTIDKNKHSQYIIERILELGRDKEIKWLWDTYSPLLLKKTIRNSRSISPKTKSLWNLLLKGKYPVSRMPKKTLCLKFYSGRTGPRLKNFSKKKSLLLLKESLS